MELTLKSLNDIYRNCQKADFAIFDNGNLKFVCEIFGEDLPIIVGDRKYTWVELVAKFKGAHIFPVSQIKMPYTQTASIQDALKDIEPKDKTRLQWFNEIEDPILRASCLAEMDGDLARERKAISLLDAMELGLFIEDNENGKYLTRVINNLKALSK